MGTMNMFTKDEQVILKNVSAKYNWIARDKNGSLFVYARMPKRRDVFTAMIYAISDLNLSNMFLIN